MTTTGIKAQTALALICLIAVASPRAGCVYAFGYNGRRGKSRLLIDVRSINRPALLRFTATTQRWKYAPMLSSTRNDEHDPTLLPTTKQVIASPPRFLATGYDVVALLNIVAAIALVLNYPTGSVNCGRVTSITTSAAYHAATRYQPNLLPTYTAGALGHLFLATGLCHILGDAVRAKRLLASDTYKRLTLGTLLFGLIGLLSVPGEAGCNSSIGPQAMSTLVLVQIAKFVTALVSFVGWEFGAGGFGSLGKRARNILREIAKGSTNVWKTLPVTDDRPATFYRTFFLLVTIFNPLCNIPELSFNLRQGVGLFSLPASLTISSIARLTLLSVILYVLKDAAERDRLERTTFVKLNIIVGLWAVGVGTAQGFSHGIFNIRRAADKFLFASLFFNNGIISLLSKMGYMKKTDANPEGEPPLRISLL